METDGQTDRGDCITFPANYATGQNSDVTVLVVYFEIVRLFNYYTQHCLMMSGDAVAVAAGGLLHRLGQRGVDSHPSYDGKRHSTETLREFFASNNILAYNYRHHVLPIAGITRDRQRHGHPRRLPREDRREDVGVSGDIPVHLCHRNYFRKSRVSDVSARILVRVSKSVSWNAALTGVAVVSFVA